MSRVGRLLRALVGRLRASPFPAPGDVVGDYPAGREDSASVHLSQGEPGRPAHSSDDPEQYVPSPEQNDGQAADVPKNFGHYRILTRLGQGGMGVVYKAQDTRLGRFVALKFLSLDASRDKHALERFRVEARAASALNHPNICTVYDIGECEAGTFIAMEFLEGRSLREHLRRGALAPATLLKLATQLAQGLEAAHSKGIVHRDVKPENLFVVGQDRLKILDFGVAKLQTGRRVLGESELTTRTADLPLTHLGTALGTSAYMSPEQARGEEVDSRSDLFSFGAVLFEMASRRRAFNGRSAAEVFAAVLSQAPALPPTVDPRLRGALQGILDRALEKKREFRYQHASDLAADLKRAERDMGNRQSVTSEPLEAASSRSPVPAGRRMAADLMKAAALTLVVLLAHSSLEHRSSGKYLNQFQLAFMQENLEHGALDESDFEAGGRHLPVIVDISALHPDKARATDRTLLNVLIDELRKHGARAIGVDLSFDDLQVTDFQYFQKWLTHENVRVGIYQRAVEKREAWLGRPEFATLAAGIALPPDNPQRAFAYSRRWFPAPPRDESDGLAPTDCVVARDSARCKEDLIQLPVALWLMSEKRRISADDPAANETLETRLGRLLDARQPHSSDRPLPDALEFGTYVIDYSYLKELRRNVIRVPSSGTAAERSNLIVTYLDAHGPSIADRVVLVGDLEDTSDQVCYTQGMKPLPGVLVHGCSLATLNRGMLLERTGTFSPRATWGLSVFLVLVILGLRLMHTMSPVLREWPYENLEIIVFASMSVAVFFVCRWVARTSGVVWPNVLWVSGALALYPFAEPVLRAFAAAPKIMRALVRPSDGRLRGD